MKALNWIIDDPVNWRISASSTNEFSNHYLLKLVPSAIKSWNLHCHPCKIRKIFHQYMETLTNRQAFIPLDVLHLFTINQCPLSFNDCALQLIWFVKWYYIKWYLSKLFEHQSHFSAQIACLHLACPLLALGFHQWDGIYVRNISNKIQLKIRLVMVIQCVDTFYTRTRCAYISCIRFSFIKNATFTNMGIRTPLVMTKFTTIHDDTSSFLLPVSHSTGID